MAAVPDALGAGLDFEHRIARRSASSVEKHAWGFAVRSDEYFAISTEHNRVIVDSDARPEDVLAVAERVLADLGHREIAWDHHGHRDAAITLQAAGYDQSTDVIMTLTARDSIRPTGSAVLVQGDELDESIAAAWMRAGMTPQDARVLTARRRLLEQAVSVEYFAVPCDEGFASHCELRVDGAGAQVDAVLTHPTYQRRGFARAVVTAALDRAERLGCELVVLRTDAEDWPKQFYSRLGFKPVGQVSSFAATRSPRLRDRYQARGRTHDGTKDVPPTRLGGSA